MTTMKSLILAGALALSSVAFAAPHTYSLRLSEAATAGDVTLAPGDYRISLDGHLATFTNLDNNKTVFLMVRVDTSLSTFERTSVDTKKVDGVDRIESIRFQSSNSKLEF